jgi:hypothetical protein
MSKKIKERKISISDKISAGSFILALLALVISARTCSDSNRIVEISEKQTEPFLQVTEVKLADKGLSSSFVSVELTIKNLGQSPATKVSAEMDYNEGGIKQIQLNGNSITRKKISSLGQGHEEKITLKSNRRNQQNWNTSRRRLPNYAYFFGTVFYTDKLNNKNKKVDWCYQLKLDSVESLNLLELEKSESGKFISEYDLESN